MQSLVQRWHDCLHTRMGGIWKHVRALLCLNCWATQPSNLWFRRMRCPRLPSRILMADYWHHVGDKIWRHGMAQHGIAWCGCTPGKINGWEKRSKASQSWPCSGCFRILCWPLASGVCKNIECNIIIMFHRLCWILMFFKSRCRWDFGVWRGQKVMMSGATTMIREAQTHGHARAHRGTYEHTGAHTQTHPGTPGHPGTHRQSQPHGHRGYI